MANFGSSWKCCRRVRVCECVHACVCVCIGLVCMRVVHVYVIDCVISYISHTYNIIGKQFRNSSLYIHKKYHLHESVLRSNV